MDAWSRFVADNTLGNKVRNIEVGLHIDNRHVKVVGVVIKASFDAIKWQPVDAVRSRFQRHHSPYFDIRLDSAVLAFPAFAPLRVGVVDFPIPSLIALI